MTPTAPVLTEEQRAEIEREALKRYPVNYIGSDTAHLDDNRRGRQQWIAGATYMALKAKEREGERDEFICQFLEWIARKYALLHPAFDSPKTLLEMFKNIPFKKRVPEDPNQPF